MKQDSTLNLLAGIEGALGAATAAVIFGLFRYSPDTLNNLPSAQLIGFLGVAILVYYSTAHQLLRQRHLGGSALILSSLVVGNLILLMSQTGGFDSSYYAVWLIVIVLAGIYGFIYSFGLVGLSVAGLLATNYFHQRSIFTGWPQLLITLLAGALGWWLFRRTHQAKIATSQVQSLSGKLSQESLKTELLMQSIGDGVVVVGPDLRIQILNPAATTMTGWQEDEAQGLDWKAVITLVDASDRPLNDQTDPFKKAWTEGKSLNLNNYVLTNKAGQKVPLAITISPVLNPDQTTNGGIAVFRDISAEKLEERQRSEFISTASHEMRTPIAAIEGYLSLALNPQVATIDDRARGYLLKAHDSTAHLGQLFRDLLSVTKLEDHQLASHPEKFNLAELLHQVTEDMRFTATKQGLQLEFSGQSDAPVDQKTVTPVYTVEADKERLREVLSNLIDNAIKFTPKGKVIAKIGGDSDSVTVAIQDSGVGIAQTDIPHLFQKFYRVDNSATRIIGGTGLGLYLARTIIELYGGKIWVESKAGSGSTFYFTLPRLSNDPGHVTVRPTTGAREVA